MKASLPILIILAGCVTTVRAADIEKQAIAVAHNRAPAHSVSEHDKGLLRAYLRKVTKGQRQLDSKGRSIDWNAAQGALIELGDQETINGIVAMLQSPVFGERGGAALIVTGRSQPLLIPKLAPAVKLNQWKNEYRGDLIFWGVSRTALNAIVDVLTRSVSFSEEVRQWAQRTPFSQTKPDQAAASFEAWWAQNQPHFEAKRYDLVKPLQERTGASAEVAPNR